MCKLNQKNDSRKVDPCMISLITYLKVYGMKPVASCCGHKKYQMSIFCDFDGEKKEIISNKIIPRIRRFYKKDKQGYYYIPEVIEVRGTK